MIYAATANGVADPDDVYVFATTAGDQALPAGSLFDGPGAFALVDGPVSVGDNVAAVLGRVVAAVVYLNDDTVFMSVGNTDGPARQRADWLAEALAAVAASAPPPDMAVTAWPNPATGQARVAFGLTEAGDARVAVYDALGREVAALADGPFGAGRHEVAFEAAALPAGVYVVRVATGAGVQTTRLTVAR